MLQHSFCHIRGIGLPVEAILWDRGVRRWDDVPAARPAWLTPVRFERLLAGVEESRSALAAGDAAYFEARLPRGETWRMYGDFRGTTAYFDIETTGLGAETSDITTIALFDGELTLEEPAPPGIPYRAGVGIVRKLAADMAPWG